jgi:cytochrome c oxidase subunit III
MYQAAETYNVQKSHRFTMWLGIISICMAFGGLTSAYLVRKAAGQWVDFSMPAPFFTSTVLILVSSATMHVAHVANKKGHTLLSMLGLVVTGVLGLLFVAYQYSGWQDLTNAGIYLDGNPAGSFFYVITGMHAAHIAGGLFFLFLAALRSFWFFAVKKRTTTYVNDNKDTLLVRTDLLSMYWHFMDILWIYLFVFLTLNLNH